LRLLEAFFVERFAAVFDLAVVFAVAAEDSARPGAADNKTVPASGKNRSRSNRRQFTTTNILALKVWP